MEWCKIISQITKISKFDKIFFLWENIWILHWNGSNYGFVILEIQDWVKSWVWVEEKMLQLDEKINKIILTFLTQDKVCDTKFEKQRNEICIKGHLLYGRSHIENI